MKFLLLVLLTALVAAVAPASATAATPIQHVVLIVEENHSLSEVRGHMPYLEGLGARHAQAVNLQAVTHPSLPNYFALLTGHTLVSDDCGSSTAGCTTGVENLFHQVGSGPMTWAAWADEMPSNCAHQNAGQYVVHHAIAPFFTNLAGCDNNDIPLNVGNAPPITANFTFVTPSNSHNAHDGSLAQADAWLSTLVHQLENDPAYRDGSTLIEVTFDEGSGGNQTVYTVFIHPSLNGVTIRARASHYSTLRLNEELLGLPLLGNAQNAPDLRSALGL